jgi:tRNA G18 (ribose-2'-O)-methylase SpoU
MGAQHIASLEDPRLAPYRHLRTSNLTRYSGRFIAESKPLVERLLSSPLAVESVLVDEKFLEEALGWISPGVPILAIPSDSISELVGFHFHRGYLACGFRPAPHRLPILGGGSVETLPSGWTGAYLIGVQDPENMGSLLRSCAAFGIEDVLLGPHCVDPFARRVLRVSMGNAFKLRLHEAPAPEATLAELHRHGIDSVAACLWKDSIELSAWQRTRPTVVVLGNEAHGLPDSVVREASRRVRIAMELGTDSLNVSVAGGIFLHYACRLAGIDGSPPVGRTIGRC